MSTYACTRTCTHTHTHMHTTYYTHAQQGCDPGFEQRQLCWIGGIDAVASASYILSFESNQAGGAGGGVYSSCWSFGKCQEMMKKMLSIPMASGSRAKVLSILANEAAGYGNDTATAPASIMIVTLAPQYVPGKNPLDITFSLSDATGQTVVGTAEMPISHLIQLLLLPVDAACATFSACERLKIQPTGKQMCIHNVPCMRADAELVSGNTHIYEHAHTHTHTHTHNT